MRPNRLKYHGLTLIEVLLVIGIIVVLASMSLGIANGPMMSLRLKKSADVIRTEWTRLRIKAMEDGHLYCFRCTLGGETFQVDRILDVHFTAAIPAKDYSLRSEKLQQIEDESMDLDQLSDEDFNLQNPGSGMGKVVSKTTLPETCFFADGYVTFDERANYYMEMITEGYNGDGNYWSVPVFFYPDGTTSTATFLLKNDMGKCIELHIRGLTGITTVSDLSSPETYRGSLKAFNMRNVR